MATVRIETEDNEYGLVDYALYVNDEFVFSGDNFTTEEYALEVARAFALLWLEHQREAKKQGGDV